MAKQVLFPHSWRVQPPPSSLGKTAGEAHIVSMADRKSPPQPAATAEAPREKPRPRGEPAAREIGGPKGPEPTRYGDWESNGRCSDF
jgi:hypothetical protein